MQVSKYLNPMENQVFQFSVYNFHSMKTSLTKHVLLVWMGYKFGNKTKQFVKGNLYKYRKKAAIDFNKLDISNEEDFVINSISLYC